jgi:hypothetical protein
MERAQAFVLAARTSQPNPLTDHVGHRQSGTQFIQK